MRRRVTAPRCGRPSHEYSSVDGSCAGLGHSTDQCIRQFPQWHRACYETDCGSPSRRYLARFKGQSRVHTQSDLRAYLTGAATDLEPLTARRPHLELYLRWLQEVRRLSPPQSPGVSPCSPASTGPVSSTPFLSTRPPSTCDAQSADRVTNARAHPSAVRGLLTAARESANTNDFALVAMLGLLGLRIFEATGADISALAKHGHRVLKVYGKGGKVALVPLPPAVASAIDRAVDDRRRADPANTTRQPHGPPLPPPAVSASPAAGVSLPRMHPHMLRHTFVTTMLDAGVDLRDVQIAARHADPRTTMRYDRARKNLDRHPNYILAAFMAAGT